MKGFRIKKITWNHEGFQEILNCGGVQSLVSAHTSAICSAANANLTEESIGYKEAVGQRVRRTQRWMGFVYSTDHASLVAETEYKALSRAVR